MCYCRMFFDNPIESFRYDQQIILQIHNDTIASGMTQKRTEYIMNAIDVQPYLALYYLSETYYCESFGDKTDYQSFVYSMLIKGMNYFKSFCPNELFDVYMKIINYNTFTIKQLDTIFIKLFYYLFRHKTFANKIFYKLLNSLYVYQLSLKAKFIIWNIIKEVSSSTHVALLKFLLNHYYELNIWEKKMIGKYASKCFLCLYKNYRTDTKFIYAKIIEFFPEEECQLNLALLSINLE